MSFELDKLHTTDALAGLQHIPTGTIDLIVTDPPYNTLEKWRSMGTTTRLSHSKSSSNDWFEVEDMEYLGKCIREFHRILKNPGHLYIMSDPETHYELHSRCLASGFEMKKPLIWEKVGAYKNVLCPSCGTVAGTEQSRGAPGMGYPYRSCYEMILFGQKGKRKPPEDKGVRDVLRFQSLRGKGYWPTQKPVALLEVLIRQSSLPGNVVLDPFCGGGSTLVAARNLGRSYLGFDADPNAVTFFATREDNEKGTLPSTGTKEESKKSPNLIQRLFS